MDINNIPALLTLAANPASLEGAKQIAGYCVNSDPSNMHNCCAATLSALLDFSGIYVGVREAVLDLGPYLRDTRNWMVVNLGQPIQKGDVGVVIVPDNSTIHHIYLVLDATDQSNPIVADNQGNGTHPRPVVGGNMPNVGDASATSYFLRAT